MTRLEKVVFFFFIFLSCVFSALLYFGYKQRDSSSRQLLADSDYTGQTYYSCLIEGLSLPFYLQEKNCTLAECSERHPILVVWISALGCTACNHFVLDKMIFMKDKEVPVLVIGKDYRDSSNRDIDLFLSKDERLNICVEELNLPFVFLYDGYIRHLFIPSKQNESVFDIYLDTIYNRYFLGVTK